MSLYYPWSIGTETNGGHLSYAIFQLVFLMKKVVLNKYVLPLHHIFVTLCGNLVELSLSFCGDLFLFVSLTCAPRRSIVLQFFWSARKCL